MAFKKENNYYLKRSKSGRDRIFKTAEDLAATFQEYVKLNEKSPMYKYDYQVVDKVLTEVSIPYRRPWTIMGFMLFCGTSKDFWRDLKTRTTAGEEDFSRVIETIEAACYTQKFDGAAAGFFNANIISRDLGLADKMIQEAKNVNFNTDITAEEAKAIAAGLKNEY